MSRDLTPRELYYADTMRFKETGTHIYDDVIYFIDKDGNKEKLFDESLKKSHPMLHFLFGDILRRMKKEVEDNALLFEAIENQLKKITDIDRESNFSNCIDVPDVSNCLVSWYKGSYCGSFYCNEENNENFCKLIRYSIKEHMTSLPEIEWNKLIDCFDIES